MIRRATFIILVCCSLAFHYAQAEEIRFDCSVVQYSGSFFAAIHEAGKEIGSELCKSLLYDKTFDQTTGDNNLQESLAEYAQKTKKALSGMRLYPGLKPTTEICRIKIHL